MLEAGKYYLRRQGALARTSRWRTFWKRPSSRWAWATCSRSTSRRKSSACRVRDDKSPGGHARWRDFVDEVSRDTPAPGGGSIAALAGSLGAALASMVANITHPQDRHDAREGEAAAGHRREGPADQGRALAAVDEDTAAFNAYLGSPAAADGHARGKAACAEQRCRRA